MATEVEFDRETTGRVSLIGPWFTLAQMDLVSFEEGRDAEYAAGASLAFKAVAHRYLFWITDAGDHQTVAMTTCRS